jgi:hypothetical protein
MAFTVRTRRRIGTPPTPAQTVVTVSGEDILVDGVPRKLYGTRSASATYNQTKTDHLIAQLDDYKAHGIYSTAVYLMGSSGGHYNPINSTGTGFTDGGGHMDRMQQIAQAFLDRGMVLVAGLFYTNADWPTINDPDQLTAFTEAAKLFTSELSSFPNVILNIANEASHTGYADFWTDDGLPNTQHVAAAMHDVNPDAIVGTGGPSPAHNERIAAREDIDILLMDTTTTTIGTRYDDLRAGAATGVEVTKPILNVETFGNVSKDFAEPRGVFSDDWKKATDPKGDYIVDIDECATRNVGSFFFDGRWSQPKSVTGGGMDEDDIRYDLAGYGTLADPGFRWWAEYVRDHGNPW